MPSRKAKSTLNAWEDFFKPGSIFIDGLSWGKALVSDTVAPTDSSSMILPLRSIGEREGATEKKSQQLRSY